jgi:hypothetical protein
LLPCVLKLLAALALYAGLMRAPDALAAAELNARARPSSRFEI